MPKGNRISTMVLLLGALQVAGPSMAWELRPTPTSEVLNGISAASPEFSIAVGNGGTIVHFIDGDDGTLIPSGTMADLFDVYLASPNAAIATGRDIILYWDGTSWSTRFESSADLIYTGSWITPEEDAAIYGQLGVGLTSDLICPFDPNSATQDGFCRAYSSPMLTACGKSDDIKVVLGSGDILHLDNDLNDASGATPLYESPVPLDFTGAWVVPGRCISGPLQPQEVFAIRGNQIWRFNGSEWINQNVPVPAEDTLTWIGGIGLDVIIASGFRPSGTPGENTGIAWIFDGSKWEEQALPDGTPGLTDVAATASAGDGLFKDDFEALPDNDGLDARFELVGEEGTRVFDESPFPAPASDVAIRKEALTPPPYFSGDDIEFRLTISNAGPQDEFVGFYDAFDTSILRLIADGCGTSLLNERDGRQYRQTIGINLPNGASIDCTMTFEIIGSGGQGLVNEAGVFLLGGVDPNPFNDIDVFTSVIAQ